MNIHVINGSTDAKPQSQTTGRTSARGGSGDRAAPPAQCQGGRKRHAQYGAALVVLGIVLVAPLVARAFPVQFTEATGEFQQFNTTVLNSDFIPAGESDLGAVILHEGSKTGPISDILEISYTVGGFGLFTDIRIQFISEEDGGPSLTDPFLNHVQLIEECDCLIDYTAELGGLGNLHIGSAIHEAGITILAQSDCDSPCTMPEPSSGVLLATGGAIGCVGLLAAAWRRRRGDRHHHPVYTFF